MKKVFTLFVSILVLTNLFLVRDAGAQAPVKMSYQAVIRNAVGALIINQSVGMKISILQTSSTGTPVYVETQTLNTNGNGLVSLEIGSGTPVSGSIGGIDWAAGPYFIKTETDPTGGTTYTVSGSSELLSVPYALYAASGGTPGNWAINGSDISNTNSGNVGIGTVSPSTAKLVISGFAAGEGLDLSSADQYANMRVLRNSFSSIDNDMFIGFGSGTTSSLHFYSNNAETMTLSGGAVGIGTTSPSALLDVSGSFRYADGNEGSGKILTSDANGNASWQPGQLKSDLSANIYFSPAFVMNDGVGYLADFTTISYIDNLTYTGGIITVPEAGLYHFDLFATPAFVYTNSINMQILIKINGNLNSQHFSNNLSTDLKLNALDQVSFEMIQSSGSTQTLNPFSKLTCHKVF